MLDAFIIERIRRQKERREDVQVPLHVEDPPPPAEPWVRREEREREERGIAIIDFSI